MSQRPQVISATSVGKGPAMLSLITDTKHQRNNDRTTNRNRSKTHSLITDIFRGRRALWKQPPMKRAICVVSMGLLHLNRPDWQQFALTRLCIGFIKIAWLHLDSNRTEAVEKEFRVEEMSPLTKESWLFAGRGFVD